MPSAVIMDARSARSINLLIFRHHSFFAALAIAVCATTLATVPAGGQDTTSAPTVSHARESPRASQLWSRDKGGEIGVLHGALGACDA